MLTEEHFFQGSLHNLEVASRTLCPARLRKDFVADEFQLVEARAHRADAHSPDRSGLTDLELRELTAQARALELDVLCEVHSAEELLGFLDISGATQLGNRDLRSFTYDSRSRSTWPPGCPPVQFVLAKKRHRDGRRHYPVAGCRVPRLSYR